MRLGHLKVEEMGKLFLEWYHKECDTPNFCDPSNFKAT
jgi:hypothetical protein